MKFPYPNTEDLLEKVPNRFILIRAVTKRAKQLNQGSPKLVESNSRKPVIIAMEEIAYGKVNVRTSNHSLQEKESCPEGN